MGAVRPLREKLRDAAHDAILEAAEQAFAEHGINAPMEKIAARAGVAVGTLYNHFENRAALLDALTVTRRRELLAAASSTLQSTEGQKFEPRLRATIGALLEATQQQLQFRRLMFQADMPTSRSRKSAAVKEIANVFADLLAQGRKEKVLAEDPNGLQPYVLSTLLSTAFGVTMMAPDRLPLAEVPDFVVNQFLHGAAAR